MQETRVSSVSRVGLAGRMVIRLVRLYQKAAPKQVRALCRFKPSCSKYMILAVAKHGCVKGIFMGLWRILRCNPFNDKCGVDYP